MKTWEGDPALRYQVLRPHFDHLAKDRDAKGLLVVLGGFDNALVHVVVHSPNMLDVNNTRRLATITSKTKMEYQTF